MCGSIFHQRHHMREWVFCPDEAITRQSSRQPGKPRLFVKSWKHRGFVETQRNTEVLLKRYSDIPIPHPSRSPELFLGFSGIFCWYTLPETNSNRTWKWMAKEDACFLLGPGFLLQVLSFRECIPLPHHRKGKSSSKPSWNFWNKLSPGGFLQGILHRLCWGSEYLRRRYFGCLQLHL